MLRSRDTKMQDVGLRGERLHVVAIDGREYGRLSRAGMRRCEVGRQDTT